MNLKKASKYKFFHAFLRPLTTSRSGVVLGTPFQSVAVQRKALFTGKTVSTNMLI